jgi:hypothetical protein
MHKPGNAVLLLLSVLLSATWAAAQTVTISTVVQHPDQYDGKVVNVIGTIAAYKESVAGAAGEYTTFRLEDGGSSVTVYYIGKHLGLKNGARVHVIGTYSAFKQTGQYTYRNQVGAQQVQALP